MLWEEERYVRLYKRDTPDWLALSFDAQGLLCLLLRKVDPSGRLELGRHGTKAVAVVLNQVALWDTKIKPALDELLKDGCVRIDGESLLFPNYFAAQEARASDRLRKQMQREREAMSQPRHATSSPRDGGDTKRDSSVTNGHTTSHGVTPASLPSCLPAEPDRARARDADPWPTKLLADLRRNLGRTLAETSDRPWQDFVVESLKFPVEDRIVAAREYIRRGHAPGEHPPSYVLSMIRDGAGKRASPRNGEIVEGSVKDARTIAFEKKSREDDEREEAHRRLVQEQAKDPAQRARVREIVEKVGGRMGRGKPA